MGQLVLGKDFVVGFIVTMYVLGLYTVNVSVRISIPKRRCGDESFSNKTNPLKHNLFSLHHRFHKFGANIYHSNVPIELIGKYFEIKNDPCPRPIFNKQTEIMNDPCHG